MKSLKIISKEIARGSQNLNFTEVLEFSGHKLKISIRSDSYKSQSHASISILEPGIKWNILHSIHYDCMQTPEKLYYKPEKNVLAMEHHFMSDREELLRVTKALLA